MAAVSVDISSHSDFNEFRATVHGLPHLEELCITRGRYEPILWLLQPEGRALEPLKRLVICDEHLSGRLTEIFSQSPALETCIVGYSNSMGFFLGGGEWLEGALRMGQGSLKELKVAVAVSPVSGRPTLSTMDLLTRSMDESGAQGDVRARVRLMELSRPYRMDMRGDLIRHWLSEAIADGSIWAEKSTTWDKYFANVN